MSLTEAGEADQRLSFLEVLHDVGSEFGVQVRRNSRFKPGCRPIVFPFDNLTDFVQPGDDVRSFVRNVEFKIFADGSNGGSQFGEKRGDIFTGASG